jgi:hypothetical protein
MGSNLSEALHSVRLALCNLAGGTAHYFLHVLARQILVVHVRESGSLENHSPIAQQLLHAIECGVRSSHRAHVEKAQNQESKQDSPCHLERLHNVADPTDGLLLKY